MNRALWIGEQWVFAFRSISTHLGILPFSLDTDNLELLILSSLAENYALTPNDSGKEIASSVIVEGLPATAAPETEEVDLWVRTNVG